MASANGASQRKLIIGTLVGFVVLGVVVGGVLFRRVTADRGDQAARRDNVQPLQLPEDTTADQAGGAAALQPGARTDLGAPTATLQFISPDGAATAEAANEPTFRSPVVVAAATGSVAVAADNVGYQQFFVRYFDESGEQVGSPTVIGIEVDPVREAETAADGGGTHRFSWVRPYSERAIVARVAEGRVIVGELEAYDLDRPLDGDEVNGSRFFADTKEVYRDGQLYGTQVSQRSDVIRRPDRIAGAALPADPTTLQLLLTSTDDTAYADGPAVAVASVVARPTAGGVGEAGIPTQPVVYDLLLDTPSPLQPAATYTLQEAGGLIEPETFTFGDDATIATSVNANQLGYRPGDPKLAYLSAWFDRESEWEAALGFTVVATATGEAVYEGEIGAVVTNPDQLHLHVLDFSPLTVPGRYQVCVISVGCSHPFRIDDGIWQDLTTTVARAAYHQRSGVALGPPYTSFNRPRPYHPEDGANVEATGISLARAQESGNNDFAAIVANGTGVDVPEAWGGHFDAGDWDRRIQHLWFVRLAAQLVDRYPETFAGADLVIPESGDAIPDLLDEALWSLDLFQRMQQEDGAIRGGIEAAEHPRINATSWLDDLATYAFAPDPWASYVYAGVAAEVATILEPYDPARAAGYLTSAEAAFSWAEAQPPLEDLQWADANQRLVAIAALMYATGDPAWHDALVADGTFDEMAASGLLECHQHTFCDAAWLYLQAHERHAGGAGTEAALVDLLTDRFTETADALVANAEAQGYRWTPEHPGVPLIWGLGLGGAPHAIALSRAYALTGNETYRNTIANAAGVSLGANPIGRSFVTGIGADPVRQPLIVDVYNGGIPLWPGTPIYGAHQFNEADAYDLNSLGTIRDAGATPDPTELPYLWNWYDMDALASSAEFTMHQSHGPALFAYGTLAGSGN